MPTELQKKMQANKIAIIKKAEERAKQEKQSLQNKKLQEQQQKQQQLQQQQRQEELARQAEHQAQKQHEEKKKQDAIRTINEKYETELKKIKAQKQDAIRNVSTTTRVRKVVGSGGGFPQGDGTDRVIWVSKPKNRDQYKIDVSRVAKKYDSQIESLKREKTKQLHQMNFSAKYPGVVLSRSVANTFKKTGGQRSLIEIYENKQAAQEAKAEFTRQSSITTAQSNAVKAQEKYDYQIRGLEPYKREDPDTVLSKPKGTYDVVEIGESGLPSRIQNTETNILGLPVAPGTPTILTEGQAVLKSKNPTRATSKFKGKLLSTQFADSPDAPASIIGTTIQESQRAAVTFEDTQKQQKELYLNITGAPYYTEAVKLRKAAQKANPYVGTANTLLYKGSAVGSSGVLIEKVMNPDPVVMYEPIEQPKQQNELNLDPAQTRKGQVIDILSSQNLQRPEVSTSFSVPGSLEYIYANDIAIQKKLNREEVKIAGSTYGDYLQTLDQDSIDYQMKLFGLGATRGFNAYTSLLGKPLHNASKKGHSLIDLAFTDIYDQAYEPIIKPATPYIEKLGLKTPPVPTKKNPAPFEKTIDAFNKRTPAENAGDILTVGTIETGIFVASGGVGNLAVKAAQKLPYLLKTTKALPTASQVAKTAEKESNLIRIKMEDGSVVKLQNFDYSPKPKPQKRQQINAIPDTPTKTIKVGGKKVKVVDYDAIAKQDSKTAKKPGKKPSSSFINSKPIRFIGINTPSTEKFTKLLSQVKDTMPKDLAVLPTKKDIINNRFIRKAGQIRVPRKDKGKPPKGGETYNQRKKIEQDFKEKYGLPPPDQTTAALKKQNQQMLKQLEQSKKTSKKPATKPKPQQSDTVIDEIILNPNRPKITIPKEVIRVIEGQGIATGQRGGSKPKSKIRQNEKLMQDTEKILKNLTKQQPKISQKVDTGNPTKTKKVTTPSFSLIVTPGKQGVKEKPGQTVIHKPRFDTPQQPRFDVPHKPRTRIPRRPPSLSIPGIGLNPGNKRKKPKRRGAIKFAAWNVDTESIGPLPGEELVVSTSTKVFRELDKRQRAAHSKSKKSTKKPSKKSKKKPSKKRGKKR